MEDEPEQENQDFAQTKPEASPIFTASPSRCCPEASAYLPTKTWDERLEAAMKSLHLNLPQDSEPATVKPETTQAAEPSSTVCVVPKAGNFSVCCNNCDRTIPDAHYHCSTCDDGDFDLCPECVEKGVSCYNSDHWLLKRFMRGECILVSTTERVSPKPKSPPVDVEAKPADAEATTPASKIPFRSPITPPTFVRTPNFVRAPMRTCNSCVQELPDKEFLHCSTCEDFDLCKTCFVNDKHGHHPQHGFAPAVEGTEMPSDVSKRLAPGRNQRHHAICDGCEKFIFGVRHKCLDCPDWDYCAACVVNSGFIHPNHRFVPIYEQIGDARARADKLPVHYGICCDGPLCKGHQHKSYIVGERYKCSVCHDLDFCAGCEANPGNTHNRTHPLIKFKTPVRRVEVTTKGEDENGQKMPVMGDRLHRKAVSPRASETTSAPVNPVSSVNTVGPTTSIHAVVDVKPEPEQEVKKEHNDLCLSLAPQRARFEMLQRQHADAAQLQTQRVRQQILMQQARLQALQAQRLQQLQASAKVQVVAQAEARARAQAAVQPQITAKNESNKTSENLVAVFERDTIEDGTAMPPNHVFEQTWVLRNGGDVQWPAGCSVKFVGGDYMGHCDPSHPARIHDLVSASESTVCYDSVAPGQEFSFTVLLRTPAREGKVISWWRLTTSDGHKFGHRLWCDVTVQAPKVVEALKDQVVEEVVEEVIEETTEVTKQEPASSSQMVFPKLDKESPEASIHEDVKSEPVEDVENESDDFEDCGVDDEWAEESDDGFLTDEEYDILDASDEEYLDEQQKKTGKQ